jgi:hypothetical protein
MDTKLIAQVPLTRPGGRASGIDGQAGFGLSISLNRAGSYWRSVGTGSDSSSALLNLRTIGKLACEIGSYL